MNQEYSDKIEKLKKIYSQDLAGLKEIAAWEKRIQGTIDFEKFQQFDAAQKLISYLKGRVVDMRKIKAYSRSMTALEYEKYDGRIQEVLDVLSLVCPEYDKELQGILTEIDKSLLE